MWEMKNTKCRELDLFCSLILRLNRWDFQYVLKLHAIFDDPQIQSVSQN